MLIIVFISLSLYSNKMITLLIRYEIFDFERKRKVSSKPREGIEKRGEGVGEEISHAVV